MILVDSNVSNANSKVKMEKEMCFLEIQTMRSQGSSKKTSVFCEADQSKIIPTQKTKRAKSVSEAPSYNELAPQHQHITASGPYRVDRVDR